MEEASGKEGADLYCDKVEDKHNKPFYKLQRNFNKSLPSHFTPSLSKRQFHAAAVKSRCGGGVTVFSVSLKI